LLIYFEMANHVRNLAPGMAMKKDGEMPVKPVNIFVILGIAGSLISLLVL